MVCPQSETAVLKRVNDTIVDHSNCNASTVINIIKIKIIIIIIIFHHHLLPGIILNTTTIAILLHSNVILLS